MKVIKNKKLYTSLMGFLGVILFIYGLSFNVKSIASANDIEKEKINIRIIGTTDLHGQVNSKDYEKGTTDNSNGLAKISELINAARNEVGKDNTITVDAGDSLYDYTTEYIFSENQNAIQPIYQGMAEIGYDAITLGNHDFDYGYDYIMKQLSGSGLMDKTVVSNVMDAKTGEHPFHENMLLTKTLKTNKGREVEVKIGIIGQTIPVLTSKTHSYTGILSTEDMVANATTQAAKLKEMGADIVITISHTGIGPVDPELNFKNVAYALSNVPGVDVVVAGHEHNLYPNTNKSSAYYQLPNVDRETSLMNGKNVIMAGNRGSAIGVVDLSLEFYKDSLRISERKSEIREVTDKNKIENKIISSKYGSWEAELSAYKSDIIGVLPEDTILHNYFGLVGDSSSVQLLNDAKIDYGIRYINSAGKSYKNYPVIAASRHFYYGEYSAEEYVDIRNGITEADLSTIQPYNNYLYLYKITGKQLKEWLEWSTSGFETSVFTNQWADKTFSQLMTTTKLKSLVKEELVNNWGSFYIFDGISYEINTNVDPRYSPSGAIISNNNRISNIIYNGKPVTDGMEFILVTDKITKPNTAIAGVDTQRVLGGFIRGQSILSDYIKLKYNAGNLIPQVDYNWSVNLGNQSQFLVKVPKKGEHLFETSPWYKETLLEKDDYVYFTGKYDGKRKDTLSPHLIITPLITNPTASAYDIVVKGYDVSGIKSIRFLRGEYDLSYAGWSYASDIANKNMAVHSNGVYSIYAEDTLGNKEVVQYKVNNFSDQLLRKPTFVTYTNRKSKITGTGEPNTIVVFEAYTGTYEGKVNGKGDFSYALPSQPSGTEVVVYMKDESKGIESEKVHVPVKSTGPNQPYVYPAFNNTNYLVGKLDETAQSILVVSGDKAFVSDQVGKALLEKNKELDLTNLKIVETTIDINEEGYYSVLLPPQLAGSNLSVYTLDHVGRNSRANSVSVGDMGPNAPVVYDVTNIEQSINGYVPNSKNIMYDISFAVGGQIYWVKTDKNGTFTFAYDKQLYADEEIIVTAYDKVDGIQRASYSLKTKVANIEDYIKPNSTVLNLYKLTVESMFLRGKYQGSGTVYLAFTTGTGENFNSTLVQVEVGDDGMIRYDNLGKLEAGTTIYGMSRFANGRILGVGKTVVLAVEPTIPVVMTEVTNLSKEVRVMADEGVTVTVTLGTNTYTSSDFVYSEEAKGNIYTVQIDQVVSGTSYSVITSSDKGSSEVVTGQVVTVVPEISTIKKMRIKDTTISGSLLLPSEITKGVKVYAKIGSKTYIGKVSEDGTFSVTVPTLKKNEKVMIWATNTNGRGIPKIVVVGK